MKAINPFGIPYPFLGCDGGTYKNSYFTLNVEHHIEGDEDGKLIVTPIIELECPFISKMIEEDKAAIVLNFEQRTYRSSRKYNKGESITIELGELSTGRNLEIIAMVIATKKISTPYDESMNDEFGYFDDDIVFEKRCIMGMSNHCEIEIASERKANSIFNLAKNTDKNDIKNKVPLRITLNNETIDVFVLSDVFDIYHKVSNEYYNLITLCNLSFVYPAVQYAIIEMHQNYAQYKDKKWCIALLNILKNKVKDFEDLNPNGENKIASEDVLNYTNIITGTLFHDAFAGLNAGGK